MDFKKFVKEHTELTEKVCNVLREADVTAEEGELVLVWLAGLSLGMRQASLTDGRGHTLAMLALGWNIGANNDDDDD